MRRAIYVAVAAVLSLAVAAGAEAGAKKVKLPKPERINDRKALDNRSVPIHTKQEQKWASPERGRDPAHVKLQPQRETPHYLKD